MAWKETTAMKEREAFVALASLEGANRRQLCERFGISRTTGYKWLDRKAQEQFFEQSRRPLHSPLRVPGSVEDGVLAVRDSHPAWGARKIAAVLRAKGHDVPAVSTVHAILSRHGRIKPQPDKPAPVGRFERERPNELWQMDFKGWNRLGNDERLHPLTIVDDHSRFALGLEACPDQTLLTVKSRLERVFCHHGLPEAFYVDNGSPWGDPQGSIWTRLRVWLLKLGIEVIHATPYHPQGRGKNERFHKSMDDEIMAFKPLRDQAHAQREFDLWRNIYNFERPHEALGMKPPSSRYRPSARSMPDVIPEVQYQQGEITRRVSSTKGYIAFKGKLWKVPEAFIGETLAIRPTKTDGMHNICFASYIIATIDMRA
jgi:transposase InsO family protein